jgi:hypothetical protein
MPSPYRDSLEALRDRIGALDLEIARLEETFTDVFWDDVAPGLSLLRPAEREPPGDDAMPEALMSATTEREERLAALQRVERDFPGIEERWTRPAPEPPPLELVFESWIERVDRAFKARGPGLGAFKATIAQVAPGTPLSPVESGGTGCVIEIDGVAFAVTFQDWATSRSAETQAVNAVAVRVPPGTAEVRAVPQDFGAELLSIFRMTQDIKLGHPDFDGYFLIQGDPDAARALITPTVRDRLLSLARQDIPTLHVSRGVARLWWSWELTPESLLTAIEALRELRGVPPTRPLRVV